MPGILSITRPIRSEAQRRLFAAELARRRKGKGGRELKGMSIEDIALHLREARGKKLVERVKG